MIDRKHVREKAEQSRQKAEQNRPPVDQLRQFIAHAESQLPVVASLQGQLERFPDAFDEKTKRFFADPVGIITRIVKCLPDSVRDDPIWEVETPEVLFLRATNEVLDNWSAAIDEVRRMGLRACKYLSEMWDRRCLHQEIMARRCKVGQHVSASKTDLDEQLDSLMESLGQRLTLLADTCDESQARVDAIAQILGINPSRNGSDGLDGEVKNANLYESRTLTESGN